MSTKRSEKKPAHSSGAARNSQRRTALIAGLSLLLMTAAIMVAEVLGLGGIIVEGDVSATVANILSHQGRFRMGLGGFLIVVILDLVVAWAFYVFLKPARDDLSTLAAWARVVYTVILGISITYLNSAYQILTDSTVSGLFDTAGLQGQVALLLKAFRDTWDMGYIFFGLHLALLGIAAYRSGFIPKALGAILGLAGLSYLIDYSSLILLPELNLRVSFIFGWGELVFMIWLLIWGGKRKIPALPENKSPQAPGEAA
jgi:hypothetical protein